MMLRGSVVSKMVLLISAFALVFTVAGGCKKKSKKSGGSDNKKVEEPKDKKPSEKSQYGRELVEGNKMIYRGNDKVFYVQAAPYTVTVGQQIRFEGNCGANNAGQLSWNLGDPRAQQALTGPSVAYAYQMEQGATYPRKYQVIGTCTEGGRSQQGTLTVTVQSTTVGGYNPNNPNQGSPHQSGTYYEEGCVQAGNCNDGQGYYPR